MSWIWRCERATGEPVTVDIQPGEGFASQSDAESWLGEEWRALRAGGADQVVLEHDGAVVYGPMSLHEPE
jgi:hypothetical protein